MTWLVRLAGWRLRLLFRAAFLILIVVIGATLLYVLREEKQLSYDDYRYGFTKNVAQITSRLRHPTGQLALLNPQARGTAGGAVHPVLLPYAAIDFDDQAKVRQAVEMAGCLVQYQDDGSLCVAIGNSAWAGGFIYVAGFFASHDLAGHEAGKDDFDLASRVRISVSLRGQTERWIAPFENMPALTGHGLGQRGRLTGFVDGESAHASRPSKDFRGWLWQSEPCLDGSADSDCRRRSFFSLRVPVAVLRDALFTDAHPVWPPADLTDIRVHVEVLAPRTGAVLLDSDSDSAKPPFSLADLTPLLLPGETLQITHATRTGIEPVATLAGDDVELQSAWPPITRLIQRLPVEGYGTPLTASDSIATPSGSYDVVLTGDVRSVNRSLGIIATRVSWFVGAMLAAILLAWVVIEIGVISRITELKRRAQNVTASMDGGGDAAQLDLTDLNGTDELGILATCLSNLLRRVRDDAQREQIRAAQEKDMWHAVGHEIMSPLQSLLALHGGEGDASRRYIERMQQAVRILYGSASPSEAFESTRLQLESLDLNHFVANVATNAHFVGINGVVFEGTGEPVWVKADEYSLEDVITHVLRNADRFRLPQHPILIRLETENGAARIRIRNDGPAIDPTDLERIFEYGVSDQGDSGAQGSRGQGLFVAKTYMAKMAGTIEAENVAGGVEFILRLPQSTVEPNAAP